MRKFISICPENLLTKVLLIGKFWPNLSVPTTFQSYTLTLTSNNFQNNENEKWLFPQGQRKCSSYAAVSCVYLGNREYQHMDLLVREVQISSN